MENRSPGVWRWVGRVLLALAGLACLVAWGRLLFVAATRSSPARVLEPADVGAGRLDSGPGLLREVVVDKESVWGFWSSTDGGNGWRLAITRADLAEGVVRGDWPLPADLGTGSTPELVSLLWRPGGERIALIRHEGAGTPLEVFRLGRVGGVERLGALPIDPGAKVRGVGLSGDDLQIFTNHCWIAGGRLGGPSTGSRPAGCPAEPPDAFHDREVVWARRAVDGWRFVVQERPAGGEWSFRLVAPGEPLGRELARVDPWRLEIDLAPVNVFPRLDPSHRLDEQGLHAFPATAPAGFEVAPGPLRRCDHDLYRLSAAGLERPEVWCEEYTRWCQREGERVVCLMHDRHRGGTAAADNQGHRVPDVVSPAWNPVDPMMVPAQGGGTWVLDRFRGLRLAIRLGPQLQRADPLGFLERLSRILVTNPDQLHQLMDTGGPHLASYSKTQPAWLPFLGTLLPIPTLLLFLPCALLGIAVVRRMRRKPIFRIGGLAVPLWCFAYLCLAVAWGSTCWNILSWF